MTAAFSKLSDTIHNGTTIDINVVSEVENQGVEPKTARGGALATNKGSFSEFLAPLTQDSFKRVVSDVETQISVVNQTLSMLLDSQGFDAILSDMLNAITLKTGELLAADRTTIFFR